MLARTIPIALTMFFTGTGFLQGPFSQDELISSWAVGRKSGESCSTRLRRDLHSGQRSGREWA